MPHVHRHAHPAKHRAPAAYRHRPFGAGAQPEPPAPCARRTAATGLGRGQGRCLRPWPGPSAGGAGRGGRPGRARCRRGLARDRPGLARPHPGSGRIVRPARSRPSPGMSLDLVVGAMDQLDWLASARAARPPAIWLRWSGDLGHAGFDASDYPDAYRRAQALAARDAHRRSAICCITRTPRKPTSAICATAPSTWRSAACPARSAAATRPRC